MNEKWLKPMEVTDLELIFGAAQKFMPPWEEIPQEFDYRKMGNFDNTWVEFFNTWFFSGWSGEKKFKGFELRLKPGIDGNLAMHHLRAIVGSFEPTHEHKTAAVAYLASLWFNSWKAK